MESSSNLSELTMTEPSFDAFVKEYTHICSEVFSSPIPLPQYHDQIKNLSQNPLCFTSVGKALLSQRSEAVAFLSSSIISNLIRKFGNYFSPSLLQDFGANLLSACTGNFFSYGQRKTAQNSINKLIAVLLKYTWLQSDNLLKSSVETLLNCPLSEVVLELLTAIVNEMQSSETKVSALYRRVYYLFECKWLGRIARACILALSSFKKEGAGTLSVKPLLVLLEACLRYNFQNAKEDDTSDFYVFQFPTVEAGINTNIAG